jgi:hypothetical protein
VLQGQDTIGYGSNLDRVPWVVSTVSCLSIRYCKSAAIGYSFNNVIVSFKSVMLLLSNHLILSLFFFFCCLPVNILCTLLPVLVTTTLDSNDWYDACV